MGRKVVPIEVKKARGTYRADRDHSKLVGDMMEDADKVELTPAEDLNERQREIFHAICDEMRASKTLSPIYARTINHLARLEERAERIRKSIGGAYVQREYTPSSIKAAKATGKRPKKVFKSNPALSQLSDLESQIFRVYSSLGMTPDSVTRTPKQNSEKKDENPFKKFA